MNIFSYYTINFDKFAQKVNTMPLRIKEVCKQKGIKISDLAKELGINAVNLSATINGNPTIATMQKIADALGVEVSDLFERSNPSICGCVMIGDKPHIIRCKEDLKKLYEIL